MHRLRLHGDFALTDENGSGVPIRSEKAKALLAYLARPVGKARGRDEIMALLWSDRAESQGRASLRQVLSGLRKDLGPLAQDTLFISDRTVSLNPEKVAIVRGDPGDELLAGLRIRDPAFEDWLRDERLADENGGAGPWRPALASRDDRPSIAVLPFTNLSGDPAQEYFSDGITEDIVTELNRFQSLVVIAPGSSFEFRGNDVDTADAGKKLGAQYVVDGNIRKVGNRVRISVHLAEAETASRLWTERYDRDVTDIFEIQDEIAATVATMVSRHVDIASWVRSQRKHPQEISAYDLVRRADWIGYRSEASREITPMLERAVELDPTYAEAHAKLATRHAYSAFYEALNSHEVAPLVVRYGSAAAQLAPGDAMVHGPLAEGFALVGEHDLATHHLERTMTLNPNAFQVMAFCAEAMALRGDHAAALELIGKAALRDPFYSLSFREYMFDINFLAGRYETALSQFTGWPEPPLHMGMAKVAALAQLGRLEDAKAGVEEFERRRPDGWSVAVVMQNYYRACARPEDGERWLDGMRRAGFEG